MQKVVGSSPISRSETPCFAGGFFFQFFPLFGLGGKRLHLQGFSLEVVRGGILGVT